MESLVIGFCICKNCGWTSGRFNWHTYFKCPECGCREYIKERSVWNETQIEGEACEGTNLYGADGDRADSELYI